jgi:hypothetical protein
VLGEFRRAAFFSALPAASEIGIVALLASRQAAVLSGGALDDKALAAFREALRGPG